MKIYSTHEAKTHLSRLLEEVLKGEEVAIARRGEPVARVVPYDSSVQPERRPRVGKATSEPVRLSDDAFEPLTDDELKEWGL